jgi:hypothetical protein
VHDVSDSPLQWTTSRDASTAGTKYRRAEVGRGCAGASAALLPLVHGSGDSESGESAQITRKRKQPRVAASGLCRLRLEMSHTPSRSPRCAALWRHADVDTTHPARESGVGDISTTATTSLAAASRETDRSSGVAPEAAAPDEQRKLRHPAGGVSSRHKSDSLGTGAGLPRTVSNKLLRHWAPASADRSVASTGMADNRATRSIDELTGRVDTDRYNDNQGTACCGLAGAGAH